MQQYFETKFISIGYSKECHAVVAAWKTPPTSSEFRIGMDHILQGMIHFKTGKVVGDTIYMGAVHPDDQAWVASHWYSRAEKAGFSHNAIIVPSDIFIEMSVESILNQVQNNVTVNAYFPNKEEAIAWINQF